MEAHIGRRLTTEEVIHHKDHVKANNKIENLELIEKHGKHIREQHPRKPPDRWAIKYEACIDCGTTERRHWVGGRCYRCHNRFDKGISPEAWRPWRYASI
jgi:hypothetical protein